MEDKTEEVLALSDDGDAVNCDDGTVSPTPVTVPKKRGRPANSEKPKKAIIASGRGRGRPSKGEGGSNKKLVKAATSADGSEEDGTGSDGGSLHNGDAADAPTAVASKRGRKPKAKRKVSHIVENTGKGRGRPKKIQKTDDGDDEAADDNGDVNDKPVKKVAAKGAKKGRGRPKKVQSDDESSDNKQDEYEEKRSVGRPSSGGNNLNIVRTGRGQGRPKKKVAEKRASETENGDEESPKRGRPATTGKGAHSPTGRPRGRPKSDLQEEDDDDKDDAEVAEDSGDVDKDDDKAISESEEDDI